MQNGECSSLKEITMLKGERAHTRSTGLAFTKTWVTSPDPRGREGQGGEGEGEEVCKFKTSK